MSLAVFVTPKLVRILDPNSNLVDVWVVEFPFWLAKYLCDQRTHNENDQQLNSICQMAPSTFDISSSNIPYPNTDHLVATDFQPTASILDHQFPTDLLESKEETCVMNPVSNDQNGDYVTQPHNTAEYPDLAMCVHANLTPSHGYYSDNMALLHPTNGLSGYQLPVEQNYHMENPTYHERAILNQPQGLETHPCFPDAPFLPVCIHQGNEPHVFSENFSGSARPENFLMHTTENGSFFIENELSAISGFVSGSLQDWGFSHPLGQILKNKRGLSCCFVLPSGIVCYVKFTPHGIKFSSNQRGIVYVIDEAGVRTCWESFRSLEEMISERDLWTDRLQRDFKKPCNCGASSCFHQGQSRSVSWNSSSKDETIRVERKGLRFFAETRELKNLNLGLEDYYMSSTLHHFGEQSGHIYIKSCHYHFTQSVFFNGKSLQVKFHTQTAGLDSHGRLSLSNC
ncbi:uncharacterized protein LOC116916707 [Daphnia magna]|uniref:uncharacterized protein LOC116916707 n=1 Tax=Daphnia magna TaxID=35525 RepID=UPI0014029AA8|nr:uncharacterized protein LOC116916707 [Daphnia magna]XP_032777926.1 uncharacterized protein LOC116916707 [Daphnia magna]